MAGDVSPMPMFVFVFVFVRLCLYLYVFVLSLVDHHPFPFQLSLLAVLGARLEAKFATSGRWLTSPLLICPVTHLLQTIITLPASAINLTRISAIRLFRGNILLQEIPLLQF